VSTLTTIPSLRPKYWRREGRGRHLREWYDDRQWYHEAASRAELVDKSRVNSVDEEADKRVHVLVSQISQLQTKTVHIVN